MEVKPFGWKLTRFARGRYFAGASGPVGIVLRKRITPFFTPLSTPSFTPLRPRASSSSTTLQSYE